MEIGQHLRRVGAVLSTFSSAIVSDHPKTTFFHKFVAVLIHLVRNSISGAAVMRIVRDKPIQRDALLSAEQKLSGILDEQKKRLAEVKQQVQTEIERPIRLRQRELLKANNTYNALVLKRKQITDKQARCRAQNALLGGDGISQVIKAVYFEEFKTQQIPERTETSINYNHEMLSRLNRLFEARLKSLDEEIAFLETQVWEQALQEFREIKSKEE